MTALKRKRTRYADQRARAHELLNVEDPPMPASRIAAIVQREFRSDGPGARQVRNWIRDGSIAIEPEAGPWTIAHAERPEDIPLVLDVVAHFRHPTWWITVAQGRWIARLRRAYPELGADEALELARRAIREDGLSFTKHLAVLSPSG